MAGLTPVNPIDWVASWDVATQSAGTHKTVPAPCSLTWSESDVSKSTAGRSESGRMFKEMLGSVIKLELGWDNITTQNLKKILNAFSGEYIQVRYLDPKLGSASDGYFRTEIFYIGDRTSPMYNASMGLWSSVSFNIIERVPHT